MAGKLAEATLHGAWFSPFVMRARVALHMKGVKYEYIEEDLSNKSPLQSLLRRVNRPVLQKVPVLIHKGSPIAESLVILEYIDDEWAGGPSILPGDRIQKAQARYWANFIDGKFKQEMWKACFGKEDEKEEAIKYTKEALDVLEKEIKCKKFFGGDSIGLVDITANNVGYFFPIMDELVGLKLWAQYPALNKWAGVFCNDSYVKEYLPKKKMLVKFFKKYMETGVLYHPKESYPDTDEDIVKPK